MGEQFAKLENNIIIAHFISMFDVSLSDEVGNPVKEPPAVNFNKPSASKPDTPIYLKYSIRTTE